MTIVEAATEAGYKGFVRRAAWPEGDTLRLNRISSEAHEADGTEYQDSSLGHNDLTADDWEVAPLPEWVDEQRESEEEDGARLYDEIANAINYGPECPD